jgi:hypothetical protein
MEPSLLTYRQAREKRGNGMIFDGFVLMIVGAFGFLILLERLGRELRSRWNRRVILRRYEHTEKILFALGEGQTIIGVKEEQNTLCFYVANHKKDGKEYE